MFTCQYCYQLVELYTVVIKWNMLHESGIIVLQNKILF